MFQSLFVFLFASQAAAAKTCSGYFYEGTNFNKDANNNIIPSLQKTYFSTTSKTSSLMGGSYEPKSARYSYNCQENLQTMGISDCSKTECPSWLQYYEGSEHLEPCQVLIDNPNEIGLEAELDERIAKCAKITMPFGVVFSIAAAAVFPPFGVLAAGATYGAVKNCRTRICKNGLLGKECIKFGQNCDPAGLRCCHRKKDNIPRQCKKTNLGAYNCRN